MELAKTAPRLAVLIDADNASAKIAERLFEEIAKFGEASVRRIYGDFSGTKLNAWANILPKFAIVPQQQFAYTTGKNAADITLVIDAMDLLYSERLDGFCLVSSDSDFTRLASRLREQGTVVYGFGQSKTPESFRQACSRFIYTENLVNNGENDGSETDNVKAAKKKPLKQPSSINPTIGKIVKQLDSNDGWVPLGAVGTQLANLMPDFDARNYGFSKLSELIESGNVFELDRKVQGIRIRKKPAIKTK